MAVEMFQAESNAIQRALGATFHKAIEDVKESFNYQVSYADVLGVLEEVKYHYLLERYDDQSD